MLAAIPALAFHLLLRLRYSRMPVDGSPCASAGLSSKLARHNRSWVLFSRKELSSCTSDALRLSQRARPRSSCKHVTASPNYACSAY